MAGGALLLIPILIFAMLYFSSALIRAKGKKEEPARENGSQT